MMASITNITNTRHLWSARHFSQDCRSPGDSFGTFTYFGILVSNQKQRPLLQRYEIASDQLNLLLCLVVCDLLILTDYML